jgi:D-amino-acid dehydrogenase
MVYNTEEEGVAEIEMARQGEELGIKFNLLNTEEVNEIQGEEMKVFGGVHYLTDAHLHPGSFMKQMKFLLKSKGGKFHFNSEVDRIESSTSNARILVNGKKHIFDKLVVATGFEAFDLLKNKSKVMPGKGYSFQLKNNIAPKIPTILCEAKVAITSYDDYTNVAGTMELGNADAQINQGKLSGIKHAVEDYFQHESFNTPKKIWHGFRPCTSTGIPVIEYVKDNVIVAGGHGMMGMSLGAASGKKVAELIA